MHTNNPDKNHLKTRSLVALLFLLVLVVGMSASLAHAYATPSATNFTPSYSGTGPAQVCTWEQSCTNQIVYQGYFTVYAYNGTIGFMNATREGSAG